MDEADAKSWRATWRAALYPGVGAAVLAMFCYSTASLVPSLTETYWAPIAAVVVLYPDGQATKKAAVERLLGTVIGSLIGWASAPPWHHNVVLYGLAILAALGPCHPLLLAHAPPPFPRPVPAIPGP